MQFPSIFLLLSRKQRLQYTGEPVLQIHAGTCAPRGKIVHQCIEYSLGDSGYVT